MTRENKQTHRAIEHAVAALSLIPPDAPAAALMRHAERGDILKGTSGGDVLLTPQGEVDSEKMGRSLRGRVSALRHSPVPRCRQTARHIRRGADAPAPAELLSLVHAFMDDPGIAGATMQRLVDEDGFYPRFIFAMSTANEAPYPGFAAPPAAAAGLAAQMLSGGKGLCVNITHDWLINATAAHVSGQTAKQPDYAEFLDALFLWENGARLMFYYKGLSGFCSRDFQRGYDAARRASHD